MKGKPWRAGACAALLALLPASRALAQRPADSAATLALDVGSESENSLRLRQTLGLVPLSQWTVRGFGPRELTALAGSPSSLDDGRLRSFEHPVHTDGRLQWQLLPFVGNGWYNTGFAFGTNDGAVWRGRGATLAARGGIAARYGPLSIQLEPLAFVTQNRAFALMPVPGLTTSIYADPIRPTNIDRPQRFGDGRYARLDPGQSTIRLDALGVTAAFSTANEWWGPMSEWPYLLGDNAAGFPHLMFGSAQPWNIGIGTVQGRVIYGRLDQSDFTAVTGVATRQFITGIIASYRPRGLDGLELGAARIFDISWPDGGPGWNEFSKPFEGILKANVTGDSGSVGVDNGSADNQLASVFARWVLPASGFEVYGELGRDDHNWNLRDLIAEPDHSMTLGVGFRKAWRRSDGTVSGLGAELFDMDPSTLGRFRGQGSTYTHGYGNGARQGHTQMGQLLGAGIATARGAGTRVAWDSYRPAGEKLSFSLARMVVREREGAADGRDPLDVQYVLGAERTVRRREVGVTYGLSWVHELNRYLAGDADNVQLSLALAW